MNELLMLTGFFGLFAILSVLDKKLRLGLGIENYSVTNKWLSGDNFNADDFGLSMGEGNQKDKNNERQIAELKERVAILEKIVTDESHQLKREIDQL